MFRFSASSDLVNYMPASVNIDLSRKYRMIYYTCQFYGYHLVFLASDNISHCSHQITLNDIRTYISRLNNLLFVFY